MQLEGMSGEEIVNTELSTGVPIVYRLDKDGKLPFSHPRTSLKRRLLNFLPGSHSSQARFSPRRSSSSLKLIRR